MSQPQAILDYASPGRAGRFRVGSHSVIDVYDRGERVQIVEHLENRLFAMLLILADLAIVVFMFFSIWKDVERFLTRGEFRGSLGFVCIIASIVLIILFFCVLHNWTSTRLEVVRDELKLIFANPVRRKLITVHRSAIHSIDIETAASVTELRIVSSHHDIRLFTSHPLGELQRIRGLLTRTMDLGNLLAPDVPYATIVQPLTAIPVEESSDNIWQ